MCFCHLHVAKACNYCNWTLKNLRCNLKGNKLLGVLQSRMILLFSLLPSQKSKLLLCQMAGLFCT